MQRFLLMKVYLASVLMVLIAAIAGVTWLGPSQAAAMATNTAPLPENANQMRLADDSGPTHPDAMKLPVAERIRDLME
jgi:hypothetical protein